MRVLTLRAELAQDDVISPGTVSVRLIPFNEVIDHDGEQIHFEAGSVRDSGGLVPVNLEHETDHAMSRIGLTTSLDERDDGLYAELAISDTALGRDALTLMRDGVLTDVSAGVRLDGEFESGALTGELDHVAITAKGAFADAGDGSKVLAAYSADKAHDDRSYNVSDNDKAPEVSQPTTELATEVAELRTAIAELSVPGAVKEPEPKQFADIKDYLLTLYAASRGDAVASAKVAEFALAGDTTTGAAGLVPDFRKTEITSIIAESRPYVSTLPKTDIGDSGMSLVYPTVTQKPEVGLQPTGENNEVLSQSFTVADTAFDIATYAGANLASRQVVERSAPSYVEAFFDEMAGLYASATEAAAIAAGVAGAGGTAILADLGADASATWAAISLAASTVAGAVRRPATDIVLSTSRWAELTSLADAGGRPMVVFEDNGPNNAQGVAGLGTMTGQYGGLMVHHAPDAAVGTCLIYSRSRFHDFAEQAPVQLRAEVVSTLSWELGIYALAVTDIVRYGGGGYTLTLV